jgi:glycosyltransferase
MSVDTDTNRPLLSIVTVSRNAAATIGDTLRTVDPMLAGQRVVEHWIVDGASTDGTAELVAADCRPMRQHVSEPDNGLYEAMNKGLRLARGTYVWYLNANDFLHPTLGASWPWLLELLEQHRPPIVVGEIQMFRETERGARPTRYWRAPRSIEQARRFGWHPPHPAFIAERELLLSLGGFDETTRIAADFKLMTQALAATAGRAIAFPHPLVAMREGGVSNGSIRQIIRANCECYRALRELGTSPVSAALGISVKLARKVGQKFASGDRGVKLEAPGHLRA